MADMHLATLLANAFGPSGFEGDVTQIVMDSLQGFDFKKDAMQNVYARRRNEDTTSPVVMLDSHTDEVGFMVQAVMANGLCRLVPLGGWVDTNIPAHAMVVRNRHGNLVRAVTSSKPPHFMTAEERAKPVTLQSIYLDFGATSRQEVEEIFGIEPGCPAAPDVETLYDEKTGVLRGKTFDCRLGNLCAIEVMRALEKEKLGVAPVAAFASQEEVGTRGAKVTTQTVKPALAIVFEGTPADDFFTPAGEEQGAMKNGVQIRHIDGNMIASPAFIRYARQLAEENGIAVQLAVRRAGGTNGGVIHLTGEGVPTLVLGIPVRYAHTHYGYAAQQDIDAAIQLALALLRNLNKARIDEIFMA